MERKIRNFLKPHNKKYKKLREIDLYLKTTLGVKNKFYWDLDGKFKKYYTTNLYDEYLQNIVFVYFIDSNVRVDMSLRKTNLLAPVKNILQENFNEKAIQVKYYNPFLKEVMNGPKLVIINLEIDSVLIGVETMADKLKISN